MQRTLLSRVCTRVNTSLLIDFINHHTLFKIVSSWPSDTLPCGWKFESIINVKTFLYIRSSCDGDKKRKNRSIYILLLLLLFVSIPHWTPYRIVFKISSITFESSCLDNYLFIAQVLKLEGRFCSDTEAIYVAMIWTTDI